ncbi:MAG TPA: L-2-amino-thiazoline-4-carboxylic acid hydrolase [Acidobacteriota bacterium]|nr:L-2-amino-thiazoline-4-carboxylic acid hydrolase [Acidobacteriota bacterium]
MNQDLAVLVNELKNRARIYINIYRELSSEIGAEKAAAILKRALYARGREKGLQLAQKIGKPNLHELAAAFMEGKTDMDAFGHEVVEERPDSIVLRLNRCPLVEAWKEAGLSLEEQKALCDIAYQVDFGKFETAGYKLAFSCRAADACKSCDMKVTL